MISASATSGHMDRDSRCRFAAARQSFWTLKFPSAQRPHFAGGPAKHPEHVPKQVVEIALGACFARDERSAALVECVATIPPPRMISALLARRGKLTVVRLIAGAEHGWARSRKFNQLLAE